MGMPTYLPLPTSVLAQISGPAIESKITESSGKGDGELTTIVSSLLDLNIREQDLKIIVLTLGNCCNNTLFVDEE